MLMTAAMGASLAVTGIHPGPVHVSAASWQENADYIFDYLTQRLKYSEAAACGIMANIRCESTFNPHAWNAGGGSYGLCQWTGGRYSRLRNWCGSNGYDYTTIDGQLAYLQFELLNYYTGVENYIRSVENTAEGAYKAGQYYCYHFEAPASRGSVSVYRGNLASGVMWDSYRPAEWYQSDGVWHYILRGGSYKTGWLEIEGDVFYLDEDGNRISGWKNIKGERYFFDDDGLMVSGWKKIDGRSYYFDESGKLITGMIQNNDDWFLVDKNGDVKYSAAVDDFAVAWAKESAIRRTELASAGTTQYDTSGNGSYELSGLNKELAAKDKSEESEEPVTPADAGNVQDTVTALADAQTGSGDVTGSAQETVTALADAGLDSADWTQFTPSSFDLMKEGENTDDTGVPEAEAALEASSPEEVIREFTAVSDSAKQIGTESLVELPPAELLRQAAELTRETEYTPQADYIHLDEETDTETKAGIETAETDMYADPLADQHSAAAQASLSAAIALNLDQEEEESLPDPALGLAFAFFHDRPEEAARILRRFKPEESLTESLKTGDEDRQENISDSSGEEKEAVSDTDQENADGSDDRESSASSDTSGTSEKAADAGGSGSTVKESEEEKDAESAKESEEEKDAGSTAKDSEEKKESEATEEESEEEKDAESAEESEEEKDAGSTAEESEEGKESGSAAEESEEEKDAGSTVKESEEGKDAGSTAEESGEEKDSESAEESEAEKSADRKDGEEDTSTDQSDEDPSEKDSSEKDSSGKDSSEKDSSGNNSSENEDEDSSGRSDGSSSEDSEKDPEKEIHIRLTERKFYDISEEELEDIADILREREVLHVVDWKDKDITSKVYMDVEKINKRDYGFSVIIRAEYGDSSDEEKVRVYLTR